MSGKELPETMTEEKIKTIACQRKEVVLEFLMQKVREECHAFERENSVNWNFERNLTPPRNCPVLSQFKKWIIICKLKLTINDTQLMVFIRNKPLRNLENFAYKQFRGEYMNFIFAQLTHSANLNPETNISGEPKGVEKRKLESSPTFTSNVGHNQGNNKDNQMNETLDSHKDQIGMREEIEKEHEGVTGTRAKETMKEFRDLCEKMTNSLNELAIKCRNIPNKVCLVKTENLSPTDNIHPEFGGTSSEGQHAVTEANKSSHDGHVFKIEPIFSEKKLSDSVPASNKNLAATDKQHENSLGIASSAKMELKTKFYTSSDALPNETKKPGLAESCERTLPILYGGNIEPKSQRISKRLPVTDSTAASAPKKSRKTECSQHGPVQPGTSQSGRKTEDENTCR